jgi:cytochrome P450
MSTLLSDFDGTVFTNPARFGDEENWHAAVAELRARDTLHKIEVDGFPSFWAIVKHADILEIERQPEVFPNTRRVELESLEATRVAEEAGTAPETLVHMDGVKHRQYRDLTAGWFKPSALRKTMSDSVRSLAREYVELMAGLGGECDFAADVAKLYPLRVIMSMLGVPPQDEPLMLTLTQRVMAPADPEYTLTGSYGDDHATVIREVFGYFFALAAARRADPASDIASVIANGTVDGQPLGDMETLSYYLILAAAGHDTTSASIAAGLEALIRNPDQLALLQDEPGRLQNAIEEIVRWASPVKQFTRTAAADYELRGATIRAGDRMLLSFPSANRDEEVFADPFRFDITRANATSHLGFGSGKHFCLGSPLARLEMSAFFTELLGRLESAEITGPVERSHGSTVAGIKHLPIRFTFKN